MPFNACNTAPYMPIATDGSPFSTFHNDVLLIQALSQTSLDGKFLLSLDNLICSPMISRYFFVDLLTVYFASFICSLL